MQYEELVKILPLSEEGKMELGLDSMFDLMGHLDNPQDKLPIIHIAGTNGKGSTAAFTASVLEEAGYQVGLFTSPSLVEFNERIQINGEPISDSDLLALSHTIREAIAGTPVQVTEFELFVALAFLHFLQAGCDIAIVEVGLGGRLDATNVIARPEVTAITKIGLDHIDFLGNTLAEIAGEKAAIIKPNSPVVLYPQGDEVVSVVQEKAEAEGVSLRQVSREDLDFQLNESTEQDFTYKQVHYRIRLLEDHQILNACLALEICFELQKIGWQINATDIDQGLLKTTWPGRFEHISSQPHLILDGSHNVDGLQALKSNLDRYFTGLRRIGIVGFMADKQVDEPLADLVKDFELLITLTPDSPRALSAQALKEKLETMIEPSSQVIVAESLEDALNQATLAAGDDDLIAIFGSFYFVGKMRRMILARRNEAV